MERLLTTVQTLEGFSNHVTSVAFSHDSTRLASASHDNTVQICDIGSGECLQMLNIMKVPRIMSFDITDSYLHTEIGPVAVNAPLASHMAVGYRFERPNPQYQGVSLSSNGDWITCNSHKPYTVTI